MEDFIFQIEVPEEEVRELKNGAIKVVKRNVFSWICFSADGIN